MWHFNIRNFSIPFCWFYVIYSDKFPKLYSIKRSYFSRSSYNLNFKLLNTNALVHPGETKTFTTIYIYIYIYVTPHLLIYNNTNN